MVNTPDIGTEIATTGDGRDITRGYSGALLQPSDPVLALRSAGGDVRIYEHLLTDAQAGPLYEQRRRAVTSKEWEVIPGGDSDIDRRAADSIREQLYAVGWDRVTDMMLYGVWYGYAVSELIYKREGSEIQIDKIKVRNRRRFRFTPQGELRLLTRSNMTEGEEAPAPYFWHFATGHDNDDEPYGLGIAHWCYWPALFKRNGIKFWLLFLEKFGMPTAVGKFPDSSRSEDRGKLLRALESIQADSGVVIPDSMQVELLEAARSGTADYDKLCSYMDAAIAKAILGQTASTQGTPGRLGGDDLQAETREDLVKADADLIDESFSRGPVRWLTSWNFPNAQPPIVRRVIEEQDDLDARSERDERLNRMGFRPTIDYVREHYSGDYVDTRGEQPAGSAEFAEDGSSVGTTDARAGQIEQLQEAADPIIEGWVESLRDEVTAAESLEDLKVRLERGLGQVDPAELTSVLATAKAAAHLAGRYDILRGY